MRKAALMASFVICCVLWHCYECHAQDLETRVRQQQAEVRQRIQEARQRMEQHRAAMQNNTKQYVHNYGNQYSTAQSSGSSNTAGSPVAATTSPSVARSRPSLPSATNRRKHISATGKKPTNEISRSAHSTSVPSRDVRKPSNAPVKDIDTMQETGGPPENGIAKIGSAMWSGWWKGAIVGGLYGLIAGCVIMIPMQLLRLRGVDPSKYSTACVVAIVLMTGAASRSANSSETYDSWAKTLPFLSQLLPAGQTTTSVSDDNSKLETYRSQAFVCSIQMPEPVYLQRKEISNMPTTILTHQTADGALVMSCAKMPSPEEMLRQQQARNPFNVSPAPAPGTVYFDVEKGLDGAAKGSVDEMHGKALYTMRIACGPFSGREVVGSIPERSGEFKERVFIANGNFYTIMSVGKSDWVNSRRTKQVLDSFQVNVQP